MNDRMLDKIYKRRCKGKNVKLIQEWLCLHGIYVSIDSDFGPATDYAVRKFQKGKHLKVDGIVGNSTFKQLVLPMTKALKPLPSAKCSLNRMIILYAKQHLKQHPREVGGQNKGPWVRLYMKGNEGKNWPWCAGFVSYFIKQACGSLNIPLPVKHSFSCDMLALNAQKAGNFLSEKTITDHRHIKPGSIFLRRKTPADWVHTGIVIRTEPEVFQTIEGNTNDEGSRDGYEVCSRISGYKKMDFILI